MGFFSDGELFIIGRIKDLLIVYGRNHSPDDIEATIQEITRGRCVAIAVPDDGGVEKLVAIVELKKRDESEEAAAQRMGVVRREVTTAISKSHGLSRGGSRSGAAWFDSPHHKWQGQTTGLRTAVSAR